MRAEQVRTTMLGHGFAPFFSPQRAAAPCRAISRRRFFDTLAKPFATFAFPPLRPISVR